MAQKAGPSLPLLSEEELKELLIQYGIPDGPDLTVAKTAYFLGKHLLEQHQYEGAKFCLTIAYDLTGLDEIREILESVSGES